MTEESGEESIPINKMQDSEITILLPFTPKATQSFDTKLTSNLIFPGGASGVTVIIIGNKHGRKSSNPSKTC